MDYSSCLKNPDDLPLPINHPTATPAARMAPLDRRDVAWLLFPFLPLDAFARRRVSIFPSEIYSSANLEDESI